MKKFILYTLAFVFIAPLAHAQVYKWVDKDGKVQYSDQPPAPNQTTSVPQRLTSTSSSTAATPVAPGEKPDSEKAPDKNKEFEKRRTDAAEKAKKDEDAAKLALQKQERCNEAKGQVKSLESGIRISRTDANGERTFLDEDQRAKELERTQKIMADACK